MLLYKWSSKEQPIYPNNISTYSHLSRLLYITVTFFRRVCFTRKLGCNQLTPSQTTIPQSNPRVPNRHSYKPTQ